MKDRNDTAFNKFNVDNNIILFRKVHRSYCDMQVQQSSILICTYKHIDMI